VDGLAFVAFTRPVGGESTVSVGSDSPTEIFEERRKQRESCVETPAAAPRFELAPGGKSTLCLGCEDSMVTTIQHSSTNHFASDANKDCEDPMDVPASERSATLFGSGADTKKHDEGVSANRFACGANQNCGNTITDRPTTRLHQAPGGTSTISLGSHDATVSFSERTDLRLADHARRPIGGQATISVGSESSADIFAEILKDREADIATPAAAPRFSQAPGGTASIPLGNVGGPAGLIADTPAITRPVGGGATIIIGSDSPAEAFIHHTSEKLCEAEMETPAPLPRFSQGPGGNTSISLGGKCAEDGLAAEMLVVKGPVGGVASVVLGGDSEFETPVMRGPVGGETTISVGTDSAKEVFTEREEQRLADFDTPAAAPRFSQVPGGNASISVGSEGDGVDGLAFVAFTRPVGGESTVSVGSDSPTEIFEERRKQRESCVETPAAAPRFGLAPGGKSTLCLGCEDSMVTTIQHSSTNHFASNANKDCEDPMDVSASERSATRSGSGADTKKHDESVSANRFACGANQNCGNTITDRPTTRLHQAPGGASTISLGSHNVDIFDQRMKDREADIATPAAAPRFSQAPGGTASIPLGNVGGPAGLVADTPALTRPVGGEDTIILGGEYPAEAFIHNANEKLREAGMETLAPLPRFSQEPGGNTSIALGGNYPEDCLVAETFVVKGPVGGVASVARASVSRRTPESQVADENVDMSNMVVQQPQGGSQTPKPVTVKRQMGGGAISVILG